jgi:Na+/phosphate symporter
MVILVPVLVLIIGLLMYALCVNPKLQEIGRIMFAFGLLVALLHGAEAVTLLK